MQEGTVFANGMSFAYLEQGPPTGPLALCLHGFPDTAWTFRHLISDLGKAGWHAVAPFLRGYSPTELAPDGSYQLGALSMDACMLHEALGGDGRAVLIGHDWGAMATYGAVAYQPERWRKAVTAAVPPAGALLTGFLSYEQLKLSWYTFFFQTPLAEAAVAADDLAFLTRLWQDWSPGYDPSWDLARVRQSLSDPARLAAAITYYRALYDPRLQVPHLAEIQSAATAPTPRPTLYLHGAHDGCVKVELAKTALQYLAEGSQVSVVPDAGHFLHLEKPAEVNAKILAFVSS